jgi:hypothetical protein
VPTTSYLCHGRACQVATLVIFRFRLAGDKLTGRWWGFALSASLHFAGSIPSLRRARAETEPASQTSAAWHDRNSPGITLLRDSVRMAGVPRYFDVLRNSSYHRVSQTCVDTAIRKGSREILG